MSIAEDGRGSGGADRSVFGLPHHESPLAKAQRELVAAYRRIEVERDEFGIPTEAAQQNLRETFGRYFRDLMNTAGGNRRG